jgi:hypothetical protein
VSEPGTESHLVLFSLHGEHYALPVASVRELIRYVAPSATAAARADRNLYPVRIVCIGSHSAHTGAGPGTSISGG